MTYLGRPAVRIPYVDAEGTEIAVRFRIGLAGDDRFRWRRGSKPRLYGLQRVEHAHEAGYVVLVEGESCTQSLWQAGFPAVGLPGANQWREDRDAEAFDGLEAIYMVVEPDQGGAALLARIATSRVRERVRLVRLQGTKDTSELYQRDPDGFVEQFEGALQAAIPWEQHARVEAELQRQAAWSICAPLAREPRILDLLGEEAARLGVVGETRLVQLAYLVATSRLLRKIVSCSFKGASATGKSRVLETVLRFIPDEAYLAFTGMSEKALIFGDEDLRHKLIVIYEASGLEDGYLAYIVRSLLSEGRIRYQITERGNDGEHHTRTIEREGPTGLLVTTTAIKLHEENETRMLTLPADDRPEQTKRILRSLGAAAATAGEPTVDFACWHALQEWLSLGDNRVLIPFAPALAELMPPAAVRLRRDFGAITALIQTHALLHQANRQRDSGGAIIATLVDYSVVHELVQDLIADGVDATVPKAIRETVAVVQQLTANNDDGVSLRAIAAALKLDKAAGSRRWQVARDRGYLKNLETRKGRPARILCDEALPDETEILPTAQAVADRCGVDATSRESLPPPPSHDPKHPQAPC